MLISGLANEIFTISRVSCYYVKCYNCNRVKIKFPELIRIAITGIIISKCFDDP